MYKRAREVLWAYDAVWGMEPKRLVALNFLRPFGGPLHMMMLRYRYVEDGMLIGKTKDEEMVEQAGRNYKLWHRVDLMDDYGPNEERYQKVLADQSRPLYHTLAEEPENDVPYCKKRIFRNT
ncbi:hypothetical protein B0T14DRAFT_498802 [Immersiella caudata]|uniref:Uncharacterized protein n=1 Tax=Immersiella caudata TaxID=314043 RepID=A0AA40BTN7_9PEZI|nr:hypothetical protein B0T14DRAFT_498802 [Immersiella caudata]